MYSSKVSSSMTIDNKTGEVKLNDFEVKVDGYSDKGLTRKAMDSYNSSKDLPQSKYDQKWPEGTWYDLYLKMWKNFLRWKRRAY
jgi:hypothetical protein